MGVKPEQVYDAIRDVLDLAQDIPLDAYSQISKLGLEPVELLGILHKLGVNAGDYSSGERLNKRGFDMLVGIVLSEGILDDVVELIKRQKNSFPNTPVISVQDLTGYMRPVYLERVVEYDSARKSEIAAEEKRKDLQIRTAA